MNSIELSVINCTHFVEVLQTQIKHYLQYYQVQTVRHYLQYYVSIRYKLSDIDSNLLISDKYFTLINHIHL